MVRILSNVRRRARTIAAFGSGPGSRGRAGGAGGQADTGFGVRSVEVDFNKRRFRRFIRGNVENNMKAATIFLRDEAKRMVNRGQPTRTLPSGDTIGLDPSKPGEPPKKVTGALQNSIRQKVERDSSGFFGEIVGVVGAGGRSNRPGKIVALELGSRRIEPRPFLRPTLRRNRLKVFRIIAGRSQ